MRLDAEFWHVVILWILWVATAGEAVAAGNYYFPQGCIYGDCSPRYTWVLMMLMSLCQIQPITKPATRSKASRRSLSWVSSFVRLLVLPSISTVLIKPIAQYWATLLYCLCLLASLLRVGIRRGFRLSGKPSSWPLPLRLLRHSPRVNIR